MIPILFVSVFMFLMECKYLCNLEHPQSNDKPSSFSCFFVTIVKRMVGVKCQKVGYFPQYKQIFLDLALSIFDLYA